MNDVCHNRNSGGFRGGGGRLPDGARKPQSASSTRRTTYHWRSRDGDHLDRQSDLNSDGNSKRYEGGVWKFRVRQRPLRGNVEADLQRIAEIAQGWAIGVGSRCGESIQERVIRQVGSPRTGLRVRHAAHGHVRWPIALRSGSDDGTGYGGA